MAQEIERKFLVRGEYKSKAIKVMHLQQGYIINGLVSFRVRILEDKGYITIKGPSDDLGLSRYEWEKEIPVSKALVLFDLCGAHTINKHRYLVPIGNHIFEVDEFHDENEGLVVAEIELSSEEELFDSPSFLGKEVTGDVKYYNASLITYPYIQWKSSIY
mgnify:CR=1 FL=1